MSTEQTSPTKENEGKKVSRVNSFTKFIRSPSGSPKSLKKGSSGNPLTKILFGRKSSSKKGKDGDGSISRDGKEENNDDQSLVEEVKEVVENVIDDVAHRVNHLPSVDQVVDATKSALSDKASSIETKEGSLLDKFKEESKVLNEAKQDLTNKVEDGVEKAKETLKDEDLGKIVNRELVIPIMHNKERIIDDKTKEIGDAISSETKPLQEEAAVVARKIEEKIDENREVEKNGSGNVREDGCVNTLAQGLEKMCSPWSATKKED